MTTMDIGSLIIAYEDGDLNEPQTLQLFANLIRDGICWQLQGHYGRTARQLIDRGVVSATGELNRAYSPG
jgi:hypothetical protein